MKVLQTTSQRRFKSVFGLFALALSACGGGGGGGGNNPPPPVNRDPVVNITNLTEGQEVSGSFDVDFTASDPDGDPITTSCHEVNRESPLPVTGSGPYTCGYTSASFPDGRNGVLAGANDGKGGGDSHQVMFIIDNIDPEVLSISYGHTNDLSGTETFTVDVVDIASGTLSIGSTQICQLSPDTLMCDFDTTSIADGSYSVTADIEDHAGNTATLSLNVQVRNSQLTIVDPVDKTILFVMKQTTYDALKSEVDRFMSDVAGDVTASTSTLVIIADDETPTQLRDRLKQEADLWGAYFIGDVPVVRISTVSNNVTFINLSDHYYRALDCPYTPTNDPSIVDGNRDFSLITVCTPDIWISRIQETLAGDDGVAQIRAFLDRNNTARDSFGNWAERMWFGSATPRENPISEIDYATELGNIFTSEHPLYRSGDADVMQLEDPSAQKSAFLSALTSNFEIVKLDVHGSATLVQFQGPETNSFENMTSAEVPPIAARSKVIEMESCGIGDYSVINNFATELLHTGDVLLVTANPEETFYSSDALTNEMSSKYKAYGLGLSHAEMYTHLYQGAPRHFIGDPTVSLRNVSIPASAPRLAMNNFVYSEPVELSIDYGTVDPSTVASYDIAFENTGQEALTIEGRWASTYRDVNNASPGGTNGFIFEIDGFSGVTSDPYFTLEVMPSETKTLSFLFNQSANPNAKQSGDVYNGLYYFYTNDPNVGTFKIRTVGVTQ